MNTRITKERLKNHFTYSFWKYALMLTLVAVGWNLLYTTTAYRPPKDKQLSVYIVTNALTQETTDWFEAQILSLCPELEDAQVASILYSQEDYYGDMQMSTYMGAGEGDIYILPRERFDALKESGAFRILDEAIASGAIDLNGMDVESCVGTDSEGNAGVMGIPTETLYGLLEYGIINEGMVIGVMSYAANPEAAYAFVDWLVETMQTERPDSLDEQTPQDTQDSADTVSDMPSY